MRGDGVVRHRAARSIAVLLVMAVAIPAAVVDADHAAAEVCRLPPSDTDMARLDKLRPARPRVLIRPAGLRRLAAMTVDDPAAGERRRQVRRAANRLVGTTPPPRTIVGGRLQFHAYKNRVITLALAWQLESDPRYAEQAERELLAAARQRNWNPQHYLDTAEMTAATALGYDWFYDALSVTGRSTIRNAIIDKGLKTSTCFYRRGQGPVTRTNNWGIVTNAGMAMGAVAVAESAPQLSAAVLGNALRRIRPALNRFGADGSYPEGLAYWRYATEHAVKVMATLHAGFGHDFGLSATPGFSRTGTFPLYTTGPTGKVANFSDTPETINNAPQLLWLSTRFNRPLYAWAAARMETGLKPLHLLWYTPRVRSPEGAGLAPSLVSRPLRSVFFRGRWGSPRAGYVAVKGGSNAASHAQPELGTFVYDAAGKRWAQDLGNDDYTLPGYFDSSRNTVYYRLATRGQNTLTIEGRNQPGTASARLVHASVRSRRSEAVLNLTQAYPMTRSTRRGVALIKRRGVLVQDEIAARRRKDVRWAMHTSGLVSISASGRTARVTDGGETLFARIQRPSGGSARFTVVSAAQREPQATNTGVKRLQIVTRTGRKRTRRSLSRLRLVVFLSPAAGDRPPAVRRLGAW